MNMIKKLFMIMLCGLFTFGLVTPIQASGEGCIDCLFEEESYVNPDYNSVANGNGIEMIPYATTRNLAVGNLYQTTSENSGVQLLNCSSDTIYSSGCALTSFAMVLNYLKGTSYSPKQVNATLKPYMSCLMLWNTADDVYGLTLVLNEVNSSGLSASYYNQEIYTQIMSGRPVIVGFIKANGVQHFVVVKGLNYSGSTYTFYINDPNSYNSYTTLNQWVSAGATITRIVAYDF